MFEHILENVRDKSPLIHCITNYVTVNDCANILLACGASPIMADDPAEAEHITQISSGLTINIGTLNASTIPSMLASGKRANEKGIPAVLDPVGAGASPLRTQTAERLMRDIKFSVIRANISEIKALALSAGGARGVDADKADAVTEQNLQESVAFAKDFAKRCGCVAAVTGRIDIVADAKTAFVIRNGHEMMSRITGSGCQLSALTAAFAAANPQEPLRAAAAAVCAMGLCGQKAFERMGAADGNASYRTYLIDAVFNLTPQQLQQGADYEIR